MLITALLVIAVPASATDSDGSRWFQISRNPAFADVQRQLQVLVDADARVSRNRFCVVGQTADGYAQAYVYWPTNSKLILWEPQDSPRAILGSRRYLDLRRDVREGDAGGSSYVLTRKFLNEVISACRRTGRDFLITRTSARKSSQR